MKVLSRRVIIFFVFWGIGDLGEGVLCVYFLNSFLFRLFLYYFDKIFGRNERYRERFILF